MPRQTLTKRQIKQDPLVTWAFRSRAWLSRYVRHLMMAVGAVVLILGIGVAMRGARQRAETEASLHLAQSQYHLWGGNAVRALQLADELRARWPGTDSAHLGQLVRAEALLSDGDARQAAEAYRDFLSREKRDVLKLAALRGEALALEEAGEFATAAARYEQLARRHDQGLMMAVDLMAAARCRERGGDLPGARGLYREVVDEHPESRASFQARLKLEELGARVESPGSPSPG